MAVLHIKNLFINLGDQSLVSNVNLDIEKGEIHGLIGESGSGKSLTALSILGLLPSNLEVASGQILVESSGNTYDILESSDNLLESIRGHKIGFVFQDPMTSLNPSIRCGKQIIEVLTQHNISLSGTPKDEVIKLFKKVRLPDPEKIYRSFPHEISGGQRQRVMIAMAVACRPSLLIADEPTTALDVTVQKSILDLIDELRKSDGLGVLFITHDLGLISQYADRLSIMYNGNLVENGYTNDIINQPKNPYTRGLLSCKPPIDRKIDRLLTVDDVMAGKEAPDMKPVKDKTGNDILLEVKNLNTFYTLKKNLLGKIHSEMHALKDVDFKVFKRESLALVGESGSGKSTLGRTLLKLVDSRSGLVSYDGNSILELSAKEFREFRKKMQFIFQDPFASLNPKQIIGEAILEPMKVHRIGKNKLERENMVFSLLEKVGLSRDDFFKYPHEFSGGQRQRIVIARALSLRPEFIVCDEAVSALDVSVQAKILNLLKDLQEEFELTYLFITHDMSVVRFFCDRVIVMKSGEIVESAGSEEIFTNPRHNFTKELIKASF